MSDGGISVSIIRRFQHSTTVFHVITRVHDFWAGALGCHVGAPPIRVCRKSVHAFALVKVVHWFGGRVRFFVVTPPSGKEEKRIENAI